MFTAHPPIKSSQDTVIMPTSKLLSPKGDSCICAQGSVSNLDRTNKRLFGWTIKVVLVPWDKTWHQLSTWDSYLLFFNKWFLMALSEKLHRNRQKSAFYFGMPIVFVKITRAYLCPVPIIRFVNHRPIGVPCKVAYNLRCFKSSCIVMYCNVLYFVDCCVQKKLHFSQDF